MLTKYEVLRTAAWKVDTGDLVLLVPDPEAGPSYTREIHTSSARHDLRKEPTLLFSLNLFLHSCAACCHGTTEHLS